MRPALVIAGVRFFDAPSDIEGSPYWVDLWASVNGYRIGLQVKPRTYRSASVSVYTGKARSSQKKGHARFSERFGGAVVHCVPEAGRVSEDVEGQVRQEFERLSQLQAGPHPALSSTGAS